MNKYQKKKKDLTYLTPVPTDREDEDLEKNSFLKKGLFSSFLIKVV